VRDDTSHVVSQSVKDTNSVFIAWARFAIWIEFKIETSAKKWDMGETDWKLEIANFQFAIAERQLPAR